MRYLILAGCLLAGVAHAQVPMIPGGGTSIPSGTPGGGGSFILLPTASDATANWPNAGLLSTSGIPTRATQCGSQITASGGDDTSAIQTAVNNCTAGQFVSLACGTYTIGEGNYVLVNKAITIRGCGPGSNPASATIITRPTAPSVAACASPGNWGATLGCFQPGNNPTFFFMLSPLARFVVNTETATTLTADGAQGASSVAVASASGFSAGQLVAVDENSGANWQVDTVWGGTTYGSCGSPGCPIWSSGPNSASDSYRVTWLCHNPFYSGVDDCTDSLANPTGNPGPNPCTPGALGTYALHCDRPIAEFKKISSVVGSTITFDDPLMWTYRVSHSAKIYRYASQITPAGDGAGAGIEKMSTQYPDSGVIEMDYCIGCYVDNVEMQLWLNGGVNVNYSLRADIETNYIHNCAWPVNGGAGYNIELNKASSEAYIANNISIYCNKVMVARAAGAGSVVAYNYMDRGYISGSDGWQEIGLNASHFLGPHHVLFEGNWGFNADQDMTHGNSVYNTWFRNQLPAIRTSFADSLAPFTTITDPNTPGAPNGPLRAIGMHIYHHYMNFIGNTIGTSGTTTSGNGWTYNCISSLSGYLNKCIYQLGYTDISPYGYDSNVAATAQIDGNYDYLNSAITWLPADGAHTLPNTYYTGGSAPGFFSGGASCTYPWPWVTPNASPPVKTNSCSGSGNPAKARFDNGTPFSQP